MRDEIKLRNYHAPRYSEPVVMELGHKGERGILVPSAEEEIQKEIGDPSSLIPEGIRRKELPKLPEISQPQVVRHYIHLSQEVMGMDVTIDISSGTCTVKYSPKVNELLAKLPQMAELHPCQDEDTLQGVLEIMYKFNLFLKEISGMDQFTFQPSGGAHAAFAHSCVMREYHGANGESAVRDEVITTMYSHPCDAAAPSAAGYKVIKLMPDENGYPDLDALKAACSERTAGLMITNPEDTGIYNPRIEEYVKAVHDVGGLCFYDQANANGILGVARAREAGFDGCFFNLHKTFSSPHGSLGPATGAYGVTEKLAKYLPNPIVTHDGEKYHLSYDREECIPRVREFFGNVEVVLKSYAWVMAMGAEGLLEVAHVAVLNNNYLTKQLLEIPGVVRYYAKGKIRLEQERFSFEKLYADTGVGVEDVANRMIDYGIVNVFTSHHPWIVPEPFTPEACETYSKNDIDYWAAVIRQISKEAYENPDLVKSAPHNGTIQKIIADGLEDPKTLALTWRAYIKKKGRN